ncbi:apolipoprotein L3-like [Protobothrops mucrosquamatus]|uniref:apolipoprotein L3-like n=1 Tax=Protobothrops mucrosquamatus TaxID=103944 RepID=UPI0010FB9CB4|nr:apolipoprotein L3-like [Protobothrops mucrosquamatus]
MEQLTAAGSPRQLVVGQLTAGECQRKKGKMLQEETARDYFVKEFPTQKKKIEECFRCLQEVTNHIDRIHKGCATASLVSSSTKYLLTLFSLRNSVQPLTIYSSTELTPNNGVIRENVRNLVSNISGQIPDMKMATKRIKINVKALKTIETHLKTLAKQAANAGRRSWNRFKNSKDIKKAFSGPTLVMTKGARMLNAVSAGMFLLIDAYDLVQDAKHLMKGGKAELASEIRKKASLLDEELQNLIKLYNELKDLE